MTGEKKTPLQRLFAPLKAFWAHLPFWLTVFTMLSTVSMAMQSFSPPRPLFALTAVFPLALIALLLAARFPGKPKSVLARFLPVVLAAAFLIAFARPSAPYNLALKVSGTGNYTVSGDDVVIVDTAGRPVTGIFRTTEDPLLDELRAAGWEPRFRLEGGVLVCVALKKAFLVGFEAGTILMAALLLVHCACFRGRSGLAVFFGASLVYGFLLESGGVALGFFQENDYHLYLPGLAAPLATMAGWPSVFYTAADAWETLEQSRPGLKKVHPLAAGALLSLLALVRDLNIDPVATGLSLWTWHETLPDWFLGVPLVNFTSWFCAVFAFAVGYIAVRRRETWSGRKKIVVLFAAIPLYLLFAAAVNFGILGLAEGFGGPSWTVLLQGAGKILEGIFT